MKLLHWSSLELFRGGLGFSVAFSKPYLKHLHVLASWWFSPRGCCSISTQQHLGEKHTKGVTGGKGKGITYGSGLPGEPQGLPLEDGSTVMKWLPFVGHTTLPRCTWI